jgi:hypothetical protein
MMLEDGLGKILIGDTILERERSAPELVPEPLLHPFYAHRILNISFRRARCHGHTH